MIDDIYTILDDESNDNQNLGHDCDSTFDLPLNHTLLKDGPGHKEPYSHCEQNTEEHIYFQDIETENLLQEFRKTGVFLFNLEAPRGAKKIRIHATFENENLGNSEASTIAYAAYSPNSEPCSDSSGPKYFIQVHSSTKDVRIGNYVVLHVKTNFPFASFDWMIVSKDIIWNNGRELGNNVHPEVKTFSVVVSPEMSPGFHVIVYTKVPIPKCNQIIADSSYVTLDQVSGMHPHEIEFKVTTSTIHKNLIVVFKYYFLALIIFMQLFILIFSNFRLANLKTNTCYFVRLLAVVILELHFWFQQ